jgi:diguanylate cyclase (GGDEF)-like protein/PAS domain S-box-containing protein
VIIIGLLGIERSAEGIGYIIFGVSLVIAGYNWFKVRIIATSKNYLVSLVLILFGLHLMTFLIIDESLIVYGYLISIFLQLILSFVVVLVFFEYLHFEVESNFERYQNLFTNSIDAMMIFEKEIIVDCNKQTEELFRTTRENIIGNTPMKFSPKLQENGLESSEYGYQLFEKTYQGKYQEFEWIHSDVEGRKYNCDVALFKLYEGIACAIVRDNTKKIEKDEELYFHKYYDSLTNLPKRPIFIDLLSRALESDHENIALVALDINKFKQINDQYGHDFGDEVLKEVAVKLSQGFGDQSIITRLGGDEFIIMLENFKDRTRVINKINRTRDLFANQMIINNEPIYLTASIGVAFNEEHNKNAHQLLKNVDVALNMSKDLGRDKVQFYSKLSESNLTSLLTMEKEMREGISNNEFILYYQPIVDNFKEEIIGMEALLRWVREDGTMVYPSTFIPIAEESELIVPIGRNIILQACEDSKPFIKSNSKFFVSVNLSAVQLKDRQIVDDIEEAIFKSGIPARRLQVEITESVLIKDETQTLKILEEIKNLGVQIALDDFGTGFSSLSYLTKLNIDKVKIDRSFIVHIPYDKKSNSLIESIITLVHNLDFQLIAEGVEEKDQLDYLKSNACDMIQGYYFYKPMPIEELNNIYQKKGL